MESTYSASSTTSNPGSGLRNKFLTVICILSFIGSGWGTFKAVRTYFNAGYISQIGREVVKNREDLLKQQDINPPDFVKIILGSVKADLSPYLIRQLAIFSFIANLLTLTGAILMYNLRKFGFYVYVLGIIVLVAGPLSMGRLVGAIEATFLGFVGIVFIVMYAVNLKQMDN